MKKRQTLENLDAFENRALTEFVTAIQSIADALALTAIAHAESVKISEQALAAQLTHLAVQKQLAGSSKALEDTLIDAMTPPKKGGKR